MSQNKTIIPDAEFDPQASPAMESDAYADFYRPTGSAPANSRTYIAGSPIDAAPAAPESNEGSGSSSSNAAPGAEGNSRSLNMQERVVVGVLFSISKDLLGEIFPIYLGRNVIGSDPSSEICLRESTVSAEHAVLFVRRDGYPDECVMSLTDYGSAHGTVVNNRDCRYETLSVKENDVLTIGKHYRFIVKTFETGKAGLFEDPAFEQIGGSASAAQPESAPQAPNFGGDFYAPTSNNENDLSSNRTVIY